MALEILDFIPIYQDKKIKGYNMAEYRKTTDNDIINPDNPWAEDRLNRQKVANDFTAILKGIKDLPFVISIDSNYGTGKTFFIKALTDKTRISYPRQHTFRTKRHVNILPTLPTKRKQPTTF